MTTFRPNTPIARLCAPLLAALACAGWQPALAAVNSISNFDIFTYALSDPYGHTIVGPQYSPGLGVTGAEMSVQNPAGLDTRWSPPAFYDFQGQFSSQAESHEGINKAWASATSQQEVLEQDELLGVYALSSWHERILVTGGTGTGTISLTVHLDGNISVWGQPTSEGLSGRGLASLNYLTSDAPLSPGSDPLQLGLAFDCSANPSDCDYDTQVFHTVGGIYVESDQDLAVDKTTTLTIPFEYGKAFYLYGTLEVNAYGFNVGAGAKADFFNTASIVEFKVPDGATVTLDSGRYSAFALPVPEAHATWLCLSGLGVWWVLRRRKST